MFVWTEERSDEVTFTDDGEVDEVGDMYAAELLVIECANCWTTLEKK